MKWYSKVSRRILRGIAFVLLPIGLVIYVFRQATVMVNNWILPLEIYLPTGKILGVGILTLISLTFIILICFLAGLLTESKQLKPLFTFIEDNLLVYIPGYTVMKSSTSEAIGNGDDAQKAVMVADNDSWKLGIEIDRQSDGLCTVFFPDPPDGKSGEVVLMPEAKLKRLNIPINHLLHLIRNYGKGAANMLRD